MSNNHLPRAFLLAVNISESSFCSSGLNGDSAQRQRTSIPRLQRHQRGQTNSILTRLCTLYETQSHSSSQPVPYSTFYPYTKGSNVFRNYKYVPLILRNDFLLLGIQKYYSMNLQGTHKSVSQ